MLFKKYDVLIVGAGISGLYAALNLSPELKVLLLSKKGFALSTTALAQGGIAAVLDESDDVESHINDTLAAGGYENNRENLRILVEHGAENVEQLARLGVDFDRDEDGKIALCLEGGHSRKRIAFHKDFTGEKIVETLLKQVQSRENITCLEHAHLLRLTKSGENFFSAVSVEVSKGELCSPCGENSAGIFGVSRVPKDELCGVKEYNYCYYTTKVCLIATGGIGRVYNYTTNSEISTGDGIRFAYDLGAKVEKMNLIQFHPTAFSCPAGRDSESLLISEAVRGEGAYLLNAEKERFLQHYGESELSPRDVVSCCIIAEEKRTGKREFFLDISHLESSFVKERFPMIHAKLLEKGYDLCRQPVPIYPCQHYLMGGITVSSAGRTTVDGLYAAGECSYTGVHGNNRLASNSLLEGLVFSRLAAEDINCLDFSLDNLQEIPEILEISRTYEKDSAISLDCELLESLRAEIKAIMQRAFFVLPDYEQSRDGFHRVTQIKEMLALVQSEASPEVSEVKSLATVAYLILKEVTADESS
ncbi:MAG: FAD-dependent oxidoreductase [Oscillospiraceae bacterium]|nr:FAD-dependent oxidoreductase [Oscillospiraceae bacterium]